MPRQFGKVDTSADDRSKTVSWKCGACPYRHQPGAPCPRPGVWLVLTMCPACNPKTHHYCGDHRSGRGWVRT